jgi:hypothetical protein
VQINEDFRDLLRAFDDHDVRYLIVGGYAYAVHVEPRYTKDLDIWIDPEPENAARAWKALAAFGAPLADLTPGDLATPGTVYQLGVEPRRVDILNHLDAVTFAEAWPRRIATEYGGVPAQVIGADDLFRNKSAAGRPRDIADIRAIERRRQRKPPA